MTTTTVIKTVNQQQIVMAKVLNNPQHKGNKMQRQQQKQKQKQTNCIQGQLKTNAQS